MVETLSDVTLKSGEGMQVVRTIAPEPAWTDRILPFLNHKGPHWLEPMRVAYDEGLDDVVMTDYLGVLGDGEIVGNITTVEYAGVGILAHVFTPEHHRRKGICTHLINALRDDVTARGLRAMYLGTGYDTHPYHIYETIGFRGRGDSGKMTWAIDEDFHESYFAPGDTTIEETTWNDWAPLDALYAVSGQWQLKNFWLQLIGHAGFEGPYLTVRREMAEGRLLDVKVMRKADGSVMGHAMLGRHPLWKGRPLVLDVMVHANFYGRTGELLGTIAVPPGSKVVAYCDQYASVKMDVLESLGFRREGALASQMEDENHEPLDVMVYGKLT